MYTHKDIISIIMNCAVSIPEAIEFQSRIGFKQHDIILTKQELVI